MTDEQDPRSTWPARERHLDGGAIHLERIPPMDVLADRYHAAMNEAGGDDPSPLQFKAWRVYNRLLEQVTRQDWRQSGGPGPVGLDIIAELDAMVRDHILRRAHEHGWAAEYVATVRDDDEWIARMEKAKAEREGGASMSSDA